jgi:hypothetical protein
MQKYYLLFDSIGQEMGITIEPTFDPCNDVRIIANDCSAIGLVKGWTVKTGFADRRFRIGAPSYSDAFVQSFCRVVARKLMDCKFDLVTFTFIQVIFKNHTYSLDL